MSGATPNGSADGHEIAYDIARKRNVGLMLKLLREYGKEN